MSFAFARTRRRRKVVFSYSPGVPLGALGATFSRGSTATYVDSNGIVQTASSGTARDGHYISGVRSLLLEGQRTNVALWSADFTTGSWTKVTATITTGIADPAGGTTASTFTATGAAADVYQQVSMTAGADTASLWIRRRTGTGAVKLIDPAGARITQTITGSWAQYSATATGGVSPFVGVELATSGDAIDIWGGQIEAGSFASSYIPTTTVAVTRSADKLSFPFAYNPQAMTVYAKFVEGGTDLAGANLGLWSISSVGVANPALFVRELGGYQAVHSSVQSGALIADALGETVEVRTVLGPDGKVFLGQSRNGASETLSSVSSALTNEAAWSAQTLWIGGLPNAGSGFNAFTSFKVALVYDQSMATMRGL